MFEFFMMPFDVVVMAFGFVGNAPAEEGETSDGWRFFG